MMCMDVIVGYPVSDVGEVVAYDISVADDSKEMVGHRCSKQEQGSAHMLCCLLIGILFPTMSSDTHNFGHIL